MIQKERINEEKLLAETPLLLLAMLPYTLSKRAPHQIFSYANQDKESLLGNVEEYKKIAQVYRKLEYIYLNDVTVLSKIADTIKDSFLSRLFHEYIMTYLSRGINLDTLNNLASHVLTELKHRISQKMSLLLQWIEVMVLTISIFSLVMLLAGLGTSYMLFSIAAIITFMSIIAIPLIRLEYVDTYIRVNTDPLTLLLYAIGLVILILCLYNDWSIYTASIAFLVTIYTIIRSYTTIISTLQTTNNILYTLRVLSDTLSVSTTSPRIVELLSRDERIPREIISILKGGIPNSSSSGNNIVKAMARLLAIIIRSGKEAIPSIRLIYNVLNDIYESVKKTIMNGVVQLSLLAGSVLVLILTFKYLTTLFTTNTFLQGFINPFTVSSTAINIVIKIIAISSSAASLAISYILFKRHISANFVAPIILYVTILITKT